MFAKEVLAIMIPIEQSINIDVLVIGAGGAGVRAAIEANSKGANTLLITKGKLGASGTTSFEVAETAGYNAADGCIPGDSPQKHYQDILNAALGTCDQDLAEILAEEAPLSLAELESWGVPFEKKGEKHLVVEGCFASQPRMHIIKRHSKPILEVLVNRLRSTSITVLDDVMVVDLLVKDNTCFGALLIDFKGKFILVQAASVILASGGGGQLFKLNLNPKDITADGYAIAFRAGAELINMEFMQAGLGLVHPTPNILNCWVWFLNPKLINNQGEEFLSKYLPTGVEPIDCMNDKARHFPFSSRDLSKYIEYAIIKEINLGNTGPHGGVFLDFRNVDLTNVSPDFKTMWQTTKNWFINRGVDPDTQTLEIAPFGHAINGGLRVGINCESTVKNLFAAGEVAGGPHGADRLGGNMIVGCQVFGKRAGKTAADSIVARNTPSSNISEFTCEFVEKISKPQGKIKPINIKSQIQNMMSANYLIVRNESGLNKIVSEFQNLDTQIETEGFEINSRSDMLQALECRNMLQTALVMAKSALIRNESRGSHFREDCSISKPEFEQIISIQKNSDDL